MDVLSSDIALDQDLVAVGLEAATAEEAIRSLADRLARRGFVAAGYADAVVEREREFPTGLPTALPVALPHTEAFLCRRSALTVGVLKGPVAFGEMGAPERTVEARVVFLLALANPKDQVRWLQRFMRGLRDTALLEKLAAAASPGQAVGLVESMLELKAAPDAQTQVKPKEETA